MKMSNCENSIVKDSKLSNYLLDENHEQGGSKAKFFKSFGFKTEETEILKNSLLQHAIDRNVDSSVENEHGKKYVLKCEITSPDNRNPCIKSVWIIKKGESTPRLVTAIPEKEK